MTDVKISRRCPTCGVSIRDHAFFCPQCGNKLDRPESPDPAIHDTAEEVGFDPNQTLTEADFRARNPNTHDTAEEVAFDPNQTLTEADFRARNPNLPPVSETVKPPAHQRALGDVGSKIQKVTNKARDVEGDVKQRVQKFREMSTVVIGEANYDPSLRFVLVAAALFVLFLIIVLLNNIIA